jgi:hypothetical protein
MGFCTLSTNTVRRNTTLLTSPDSTDALFRHTDEKLPDAALEAFECPIKEGEILYAIAQGKKQKSPGQMEYVMSSTKYTGK